MAATYTAPDYIRHAFKVSKELKSYTVYKVDAVESKTNLLTDLVRIEPYFGNSAATKINEYLRLRDTKNWTTCEQVTGLRPTNNLGIYYGDRITPNGKKSLLIFSFSKDRQTLFIDVYRSFYPEHNGILQSIIKNY